MFAFPKRVVCKTGRGPCMIYLRQCKMKRSTLIFLVIGLFVMALVPFLSNTKAWTEGRLPEPWPSGKPSIFQFIEENGSGDGHGDDHDDLRLPDEVEEENSIRWVSGGLDGAFGHHGGAAGDNGNVSAIFNALKRVLKNPSHRNMTAYYELIKDEYALDFIDELLEKILNDRSLNNDRLIRLSSWIAENSPDRGPVKVSVAVMGVLSNGEFDQLFLTLGRHDEFTLYSAVALAHSSSEPEEKVWQLANSVHGWGRIQAVERLSDTKNPEIKAWMVREGYKNNIMYEYLAYLCATTGGLVDELRKPKPDEELLKGAGDIISALIMGGPAEDMGDYAFGAEATELYLQHISRQDLGLNEFILADTIKRYAFEVTPAAGQERQDWTLERVESILMLSNSIITRDGWDEQVALEIQSDDRRKFWTANQAAKLLGIDTWRVHFDRTKNNPKDGNWFELLQTDDVERVRQVIEYATEQLPLSEIATGPSDLLGLGREFWAHSALDYIVQDLRRFPGEGWVLVKTAMGSPVVRNRNMALNALNEWPRNSWPEEAEKVLCHAEQVETEHDLKERIVGLLAGDDISPKPLEFSDE